MSQALHTSARTQPEVAECIPPAEELHMSKALHMSAVLHMSQEPAGRTQPEVAECIPPAEELHMSQALHKSEALRKWLVLHTSEVLRKSLAHSQTIAIQVIGGLIQHQDVGVLPHGCCQHNLHFHASAELS